MQMIANSRGGEYASGRLLDWEISLSGNILKCYRLCVFSKTANKPQTY